MKKQTTVKPGNDYKGKVSGEFHLVRIKNVNGQPIFVINVYQTTSTIELTLDEMREEKPKSI